MDKIWHTEEIKARQRARDRDLLLKMKWKKRQSLNLVVATKLDNREIGLRVTNRCKGETPRILNGREQYKVR